MKAIIMKSEDKESWYKSLIGKMFNVLKVNKDTYVVRYKNNKQEVKISDCEVIG
jgi:hypothetical protein